MTAGIAYPADYVAGVTGPKYTAQQGRTALAAAMSGATSTRPLGGLSGVRPGTPTNTITATSTTWTGAPFGGYIDTEASATNGGYYFSFPLGTSGSITAAGASARQDGLFVVLSDQNTGDGTTTAVSGVDVVYQAGNLTPPARSFQIATINVPATGGGSPTVTWVAPYTAAAGGVVPASTLSALPTTLADGTFGVTLDTLLPYTSVSGTWGTLAKRIRTVAGTASGSLSGASWLNLAAQQIIPANPFGTGVKYTIRVKGTSNATLTAGNTYAIRVLIDGAAPTIGGQNQTAGTGGISIDVEARHTITSPTSSHTVDVQILAVTGTATVSSGSSISWFEIEIERTDTF